MSAIIFLAGYAIVIVISLFGCSLVAIAMVGRLLDVEMLFLSVLVPIVVAGSASQGLHAMHEARHRLNAAYESGSLTGNRIFIWGVAGGFAVLLSGAIIVGVALLSPWPWLAIGALLTGWLMPPMIFERFEKSFTSRLDQASNDLLK